MWLTVVLKPSEGDVHQQIGKIPGRLAKSIMADPVTPYSFRLVFCA